MKPGLAYRLLFGFTTLMMDILPSTRLLFVLHNPNNGHFPWPRTAFLFADPVLSFRSRKRNPFDEISLEEEKDNNDW